MKVSGIAKTVLLFPVDVLGLFLFLAGFAVRLGAVTVIEVHGFLGKNSPYWNEATTRTHRMTKPLIWIGILLTVIGGGIVYRDIPLEGMPPPHTSITCVLILNGLFLLFSMNPFFCGVNRREERRNSCPCRGSGKSRQALSYPPSAGGARWFC